MTKKIAVIGSGISGLSAAWLLSQKYDVTLFEKNATLGGHANTVDVEYPNGLGREKISVDTGFIVYNFRTYHHLKQLFEFLKIEICASTMSFGIKDYSSGLEYVGSDLSGVFAQKRNLLNPAFWLMIFDILKFNKNATKLVEEQSEIDDSLTLETFVNRLKLGKYFKEHYLFPMASAIWSCPVEQMKLYPAKTFLRFFYNHGLLTVTNQPQWYSVKNGSREYIKKLSASFADKIKLSTEITKCHQGTNGLTLEDRLGNKYEFDHVVFASHANETFKIISDKTPEETRILSKFKFSQNLAVLHRDENQMPKNKKAWASWVYLSAPQNTKTSLSYWMNNLQAIEHKFPLFVTLNPIEEVDPAKVFGTFKYEHPIFDFDAIAAQEEIKTIQGKRNIWFAGAWLKYGFHEDGISSAIELANKFEVRAPWQK
ncbi:MAG: FAD-dependent oxidoreductase [Rickettsiales bacterium]|nr:FAD-dependent oxidoreductase [Rickettsiales bacterium]